MRAKSPSTARFFYLEISRGDARIGLVKIAQQDERL